MAYVQLKFLFENHFNKHQLQIHLLHFFLHVCILNFLHQFIGDDTVWYYLYPLLTQVLFVSFASMSHNPDTGIKDLYFSLKLQNSALQKLRTFKVPLPRPQKVKNIRLSKRWTPPISRQKPFPRWCPLIRESTVDLRILILKRMTLQHINTLYQQLSRKPPKRKHQLVSHKLWYKRLFLFF